MIRIIMNPCGLNATVHLTSSVGCFNKRFFNFLSIDHTVNENWKAISERLDEKARSLIFGGKKYTEMSRREQDIVDAYQQKKLKEAPVILPNTGADLEQKELEQLLQQYFRNRNKGNE